MSQTEIAEEMNSVLPIYSRNYTFSDVSRFERYGCDKPVYQSYLDAGERIVQREAAARDARDFQPGIGSASDKGSSVSVG